VTAEAYSHAAVAQGKTCTKPVVVSGNSIILRLSVLRDTDTYSDVLRRILDD
jgi:hypothetical protein